MQRLENVRYVTGAPKALGWLSVDDRVSIELETKDAGAPVLPNGRPPQVLSALLIATSDHVERIAMEAITDIAVGTSEPAPDASSAALTSQEGLGKFATPKATLNRLFDLPREPYRWLAIGFHDTTMVFDVIDRHWADEELWSGPGLADRSVGCSGSFAWAGLVVPAAFELGG